MDSMILSIMGFVFVFGAVAYFQWLFYRNRSTDQQPELAAPNDSTGSARANSDSDLRWGLRDMRARDELGVSRAVSLRTYYSVGAKRLLSKFSRMARHLT